MGGTAGDNEITSPCPIGSDSSGAGIFLLQKEVLWMHLPMKKSSGQNPDTKLFQERKENMIKPDCETTRKLAKTYSVIPVYQEFLGDVLTPIAILKKLAENSSRYYLLESVEGGKTWGRYSFLGCDPLMRITCRDCEVTIERNGKKEIKRTETPLEVLRNILKEYKAPVMPELPPFTGGMVGYFAYSMIGYEEPVLKIKKGGFADYDVMLFDKVIAYDHLRQKLFLIANINTDNVIENYGKAAKEIERLAAMLKKEGDGKSVVEKEKICFQCSTSKEEYCRMVEKTKEYIRNGDIFQAVISRQFHAKTKNSILPAYRILRTTNPSPYMVYFHTEDEELMSTSPETLVRLNHECLATFPVAGSRPRGATKEEDDARKTELLSDEKELAEHDMLVDLGRNDLGKISKFGSVEVTKYKEIHQYSKIMHICSQVEGEIDDGKDALDAIASVLPAGTLSGAPKIRACQIIEKLEKEERGIYGGAIGYLDFTGNMDTCIAIRMAVKKGDTVYVQAGGGIVADSVPEMEYEESANKAAAVIQAVVEAGEAEEL